MSREWLRGPVVLMGIWFILNGALLLADLNRFIRLNERVNRGLKQHGDWMRDLSGSRGKWLGALFVGAGLLMVWNALMLRR